jgi:glycosyltransferase involved in cell wall biosynthesis
LYIREAVASILNQTYTDFEFLIIDDASTDDTVAIIKSIEDPRIKLIEKPKNTGYTTSLNYGLSIAQGKYIARMDADDISLPQRFEKQVTFLEKHPEVVVCGTGYSIIGTNTKKQFPEGHEDLKIELLKGTCFGHPTVMMRKQVLEAHALQYETTKEPAEDYDLWVKLLAYGKLHNLQDILLKYRVHDNQVSQERRTIQLQSKLETRLNILNYLNFDSNKRELDVFRKVLILDTLNNNELYLFNKLKQKLLKANDNAFFREESFINYLNELEHSMCFNYFVNRSQFYPKVFLDYLKFKKQIKFKLSIINTFKLFIKSLTFHTN